ncbi:hypothetical protein M6B38_308785 [Iris pallida]|uniref:Uncharacterized protein n=1 Tax=Iris pallida TaxID=29817 RepID=A0AAX6HL24_IRIPA|nr:hypothetical protein M6B38_308785 [Iris pallida]
MGLLQGTRSLLPRRSPQGTSFSSLFPFGLVC